MTRWPPLADRFFACFVADDETGCWVWRGGLSVGYGRIHANGRRQMAHRVGYELLRGPIPAGHELDHRVQRLPAAQQRPAPGAVRIARRLMTRLR